jgi:hypothetical protein
VDELLRLAYQLGLKGCTVFRAGARQAMVEPHARAIGLLDAACGARSCAVEN